MWFFRRKRRKPAVNLPHRDVGAVIEIAANKEAAEEMAEKSRAASRRVLNQLDENHFTITIYAAAGGGQHNS
jgi:hypothetical protein